MRLSAGAVALGAILVLASGFRPGALPYIPGARFSDAAISHWPAALTLRRAVLERGQYPLWSETILAGQPFAANPLNKTAYPPQWLALLLPPALHLDLMIVLHLLIAGAGMARWGRGEGLRPEAAAFSGLAYGLAPRLLAHTGAGHLDVLYALAWWPWLMEAVRGMTAAPRRPLLWALAAGLLAGLVALADVRVSLFALPTAAAYGAVRWWNNRRAIALAPLAALLAAVVALPVVVPLAGWQPYLTRAALAAEDAAVFSLQPAQLAGLVGLPAHGGNHELLAYVGLPVLLLAVIGVVAQPRRLRGWVIASAAAGLYALGSHAFAWPALVNLIPALAAFRVPARAFLVVVLVAPLLAGFGVDTLVNGLSAPRRTASQARRARLLALIALVAFTAGGVFLWLAQPALRGTAVAFLAAGAVALLALVALARPIPAAPLAVALLAVAYVDLAAVGLRWLDWRGPETWLDPFRPLAARLQAEGADRIYAAIYDVEGQPVISFPQEAAAAFDLRLFNGIDPFQLAGIAGAVNQAAGTADAAYSVVLPPLITVNEGSAPAPDTDVLAAWGVSHVVSALPIESDRLSLVDTVDGVYLYRNLDHREPALNPFGWPDGWPGLPDAGTVERLNRQTVLAAAISASACGLALVALIVLARRPET